MTEHPQESPAAGVDADVVLDSLPDPVLLITSAREVAAVNKAAREVLQVQLVGRDLAQSVRHPAALAAVDEVLAGADVRTAEISLPAPVRRDFVLYAARVPAADDADSPRAVCVFHDVTAAKRSEQMRADFVANVGHELRSPLSALIGIIETLRDTARDDPETRERFLGIMHAESQRMSRLIADLLSLSRVEINEHVQPRDLVDICGVLADVSELLAQRAAERDMTVVIERPDLVAPVVGDRDELVQVFQNLIDNAITYAASGTGIEVHVGEVERVTETGGPGISVTVADHGEGIPADDLPRLTERFYRVDKARSRSLGGTGLGLAIVKHIVSRHRGQLAIDSTHGEGSRFTVILPVVAPSEADGGDETGA